jgi:UDP-3-O-[3-hydroxymyristoyl] glucosamine N-acyltransferase
LQCYEDEVTIWGQVGTTSGITIGKKAGAGRTRVTKSVEGGKNPILHTIEESRGKIKITG